MDSQLIQTLIMFGALGLFFWLLILRPQQQAARRSREMRDAIKQNDILMLNSGFEVKVRHIDEGTLTVEMGDEPKITVKISKEVVVANVSQAERDAEDKKKAEDEKAEDEKAAAKGK